jgi:hypothetical protein
MKEKERVEIWKKTLLASAVFVLGTGIYIIVKKDLSFPSTGTYWEDIAGELIGAAFVFLLIDFFALLLDRQLREILGILRDILERLSILEHESTELDQRQEKLEREKSVAGEEDLLSRVNTVEQWIIAHQEETNRRDQEDEDGGK